MMPQVFGNKEAKRAGKHNIDYAKHHTLHRWLPAKVMYPANSTNSFSWLIRSTSIIVAGNVQIYIQGLTQAYNFIFLLPDFTTDFIIMGKLLT